MTRRDTASIVLRASALAAAAAGFAAAALFVAYASFRPIASRSMWTELASGPAPTREALVQQAMARGFLLMAATTLVAVVLLAVDLARNAGRRDAAALANLPAPTAVPVALPVRVAA